MTVCHYFLQGRCRFGQNCRYDHSNPNDDRNTRAPVTSQQLNDVISRQIVGEVLRAEKGGQWPLSCFSPVKEGVNIPGWEDTSPEEVRWKMYEARANGTLNQCINEVNQLYSNAEKRRNALKQPSAERNELILTVLRGKKELPQSNPFGSSSDPNKGNFQFNTSSTNIFGAKNANTQANIFGGGSQPSANQSNIFGGAVQSTPNQGSIFGGATSPAGSQNIFAGSVPSPSGQGSIFAGTSSNFTRANVFGGPTTPTANQNIFANAQSTSIFGSPPTVAGGSIFAGTPISSPNAFATPQTPTQGSNQTSGIFSNASSAMFQTQGQNNSMFGAQNAFAQSSENKTQNIFGGPQNSNFQSQNVFAKNENIFSSQKPSQSAFESQNQSSFAANVSSNISAVDTSVYSKVEDLMEEELKCFAAATFTFGKIPLKPPPQSYCK